MIVISTFKVEEVEERYGFLRISDYVHPIIDCVVIFPSLEPTLIPGLTRTPRCPVERLV